MSLNDYHRKRDFAKTPEPSGGTASKAAPCFVIQKHDARTLHYDLRLEADGVLKSWAVPKGPDRDPKQRRLAIQTEDHPMDYADFEGVIPQGEYGGGTVMVWDTGTWETIKGSFSSGRLTFTLHGKKLQGAWQIIRTSKRGEKQLQWLLKKVDDEFAKSKDDPPILESHPRSVLTDRSLEEIAKQADRVWTQDPQSRDASTRENQTGESGELNEQKNRIRSFLQSLSPPIRDSSEFTGLAAATHGSELAPYPTKAIQPTLPTSTRIAPKGDEWVHEIKYDGYRMLCHIEDGKVRFVSRNGTDYTDKLPGFAAHAANLPIHDAILDGEVAVVEDDGRTDFQELQTRIGKGDDSSFRFFVFDLLYLNGHDLSKATLLDRKSLLHEVLKDLKNSPFQYSDHIVGQGGIVFSQASKLGTEGIVSKRANSRYVFGRTDVWQKVKCLTSSEFVVGGYTVSDTKSRGIGSLVLGRYEDKKLVYEGRVGTGFTSATLQELENELSKAQTEHSPFSNLDSKTAGREYRWVDPKMVIEVEYSGWTRDRILRFATYRGRRDEIDSTQVVCESEASGPKEAKSAGSEIISPPMNVDFDSLESFRLTHPERIVYPQDGVTKLGLATYYGRIAGWMLPHLVNRPLALVRCPQGVGARCFFQKKPIKGMPATIQCPEIAAEGRTTQHPPMVQDLEGLMALIQFGTLEIHTWGCLLDRPDRPDMITFDFDPDDSLPFHQVCEAALMLREHLNEIEIEGYLKTTGGKGLHVVIPIQRRSSWEEVIAFCDAVGGRMVSESPSRFTTSPSKNARKGKIYIDTLRNRFGATSICAFSTRAKEHATISLPIGWEEITSLTAANVFSIANAFHRLDRLSVDPWDGYDKNSQRLTKSSLKEVAGWLKR